MPNIHSETELTRSLRAHARENLMAFTICTKPDYAANWHHEELAKVLDEVAARRCRRLMVFMPPQHGKSELVSRRFPAYMLGRNPDLRLICASHTSDLAVGLNRDVQRIMTGDAYAQIFSETTLHGSPLPYSGEGGHHVPMVGVRVPPFGFPGYPRSRVADFGFPTAGATRITSPFRISDFGFRISQQGVRARPRPEVIARRTLDFFEIPGHRGSLRSAGVGNSIAGNRADGAIIDDPFGKREDAESPAMRQRVWEWYTSDLYTRLAADAWIVLTHTRWHRDDLAGRLLRKMADRSAEQWEILCLPAVRGEGPGHPCDRREPGEPLWPQFKSAAELEVIRRQDARAYAALYQQDPADASAAEWAPELFGDWIWVPPERWPREFKLRVVCVDASKGRKDKQGDYSAIVFMGIGADRLLYVDAILERIPLDQIVRKIVVFCDEKRPDLVGIEGEQFQELLVHEFRRQCGEGYTRRWPLYEMMTGGVPKVARIRRLSQYVINRELRFKADSPGCRLLVDQLMDFPLAEHDDGPDALEMCTQLPLKVRWL